MTRPLLAFLILLMTATQSLAGDWRVIPIRLFLGPQIKNDSVRLINNGSDPLNLQLKATAWTQNDQGEDVYEETSDIIFFPRVLTIPPGEERLLRAGYKFPAITEEKTYRLFIEEIPLANPQQGAAVVVAVRFGLPIFVAPPDPQRSASIEQVSVEHGVFSAQVQNTGNMHLLPSEVKVSGRNAGGETLFTLPLKAWYLLTGNHRRFSDKLDPQQCSETKSLLFEFNADALHLTQEAPLSQADCQH